MSFTPAQKAALLYILLHEGRCYDGEDRTMRSLEQRGLIRWTSVGRYGKNHWRLTEVGYSVTSNWVKPK